MRPHTIAGTGIAATTVMSLYSYVLSAVKQEQFREPEVLAALIVRLSPHLKRSRVRALAWGVHYAVGVFFAAIYHSLWRQQGTRPRFTGGLLAGGITGIGAIAVWRAVIAVHPCPPRLRYRAYYGQLLPAHVLFGIAAAAIFRFSSSRSPSA